MTVSELFNCCLSYFNEIHYYDRTNNIQDYYSVKEFVTLERMERKFLDEYGDYKVLFWECDMRNCSIHVEIESEE